MYTYMCVYIYSLYIYTYRFIYRERVYIPPQFISTATGIKVSYSAT